MDLDYRRVNCGVVFCPAQNAAASDNPPDAACIVKTWQFWTLLLVVAATLYVTVRIALGLQSAQSTITESPLVKFLSKL